MNTPDAQQAATQQAQQAAAEAAKLSRRREKSRAFTRMCEAAFIERHPEQADLYGADKRYIAACSNAAFRSRHGDPASHGW